MDVEFEFPEKRRGGIQMESLPASMGIPERLEECQASIPILGEGLSVRIVHTVGGFKPVESGPRRTWMGQDGWEGLETEGDRAGAV